MLVTFPIAFSNALYAPFALNYNITDNITNPVRFTVRTVTTCTFYGTASQQDGSWGCIGY